MKGGHAIVLGMSTVASLRVALLAPLLLLALPTTARAYTVETVVSDGCHEAITMSALRAARAVNASAAPLPLVTGDDTAMANDLPYTPASDMKDLGAIALVLGVRSNDLKGAAPTDLDQLAVVQGDPTTQEEHCLRNDADLEPNGTPDAILQCRTFILSRVAAALTFLGPDGNPSSSAEDRTGLDVSLSLRGEVTVPLPGFYVNMGQALHAVEDSFAHTFRANAAGPITTTLNYLEIVDGNSNQALYGPPHRVGLDACKVSDSLRLAKLTVAEQSAEALLLAALGPGSTSDRMASATTVLDTVLAYQPGCTAANKWCDAPEQAYPETLSCAMAWGRGSALSGLVLVAASLGLALRRRRRKAAIGAAVGLVAALACASTAAATELPTTEAAPAPPPPSGSRFGVIVRAGGAVDHPALALSGGGRFEVTHTWVVGLDAEYNPWISLTGPNVRNGAFNAYASVIHRWPSTTGAYDLTTSFRAGSSTALIALFGVPLGSTGVFVGGDLLGIEFHIPRHLHLVVDPAELAFPVPQLRGTPFGYLQYRVMVGLAWGADR